MKDKGKFVAVAAIAFFAALFVCVPLFAAGKGTITADVISYNANTKNITARGGVVIKKDSGTISADQAEGNADRNVYVMTGSVRGLFPKDNIEIKTADKLKWSGSAGKSRDGVAEAFGRVFIARVPSDWLKADYVQWELGTDNYQAKGGVDAVMEDRVMAAAEVGRKGERFWARSVSRYLDRRQKTSMSAASIEGIMRNNIVQESVAKGDVTLEYLDKTGLKTVVKGDSAVYSKARGTVVVSGSASAVRSDGKTVAADSLVLHEDTKDIDAIGNSRITVILEDNGNAAGKPANKKKSSQAQ